MEQTIGQLHAINGPLIRTGFFKLLPISSFVIIYGVAFGVASVQVPLTSADTMLMSILVFAGASQFAALELWGPDVEIFTLIMTVFAINARHLLMGASLYPWLRHLPTRQRYGTLFFVSDANWAMSLQAFNKGLPGLGFVFGGGIALWLSWIFGTWLGVAFGSAVSNPMALGLDMVMGCFLLSMVVGGDKNMRMLAIWVVAAFASLLAFRYLPENSHVVVGALAGGIGGLIWGTERNEH